MDSSGGSMSQRLCLLIVLALVPLIILAQTAKPAAATKTDPRTHKSSQRIATPPGTSAAGVPAVVVPAMKAISGERIREHIRFLSHDLLEGRGTGARGGDIAGQYIATQFALMGLEPAGDN